MNEFKYEMTGTKRDCQAAANRLNKTAHQSIQWRVLPEVV